MKKQVTRKHTQFDLNAGKRRKSPWISYMKKPPMVVVHSLSHVQLFPTPWTAAHKVSLSFTVTQSWLKLMLIELTRPSNHLILCHPFHFLLSVFPRIRIFSNESALCIR